MANISEEQRIIMKDSGTDGPFHSCFKDEPVDNSNELCLSSLSHLSDEVRQRLTYKMNNAHRSIAIIFNHRNFEVPGKDLKVRENTDKDCRSLRKCFRDLGFHLRIYHDKKRKEIEEILLEASRIDHTNSDCLVVIVLTHGDMGLLYAKDDSYDEETLWINFTKSRCSSLIGKPKLFFIQACRGERMDPGFVMNSNYNFEIPENNNFGKVFSNPIEPYYNDQTEPQKKSGFQLVLEADFLIAFATLPEFVAWKGLSGSWFIQFLCQELTEKCSTHHLLEILTFVSRSVAIDRESHSWFYEEHEKKQMLCIESTLTKLMFFGSFK